MRKNICIATTIMICLAALAFGDRIYYVKRVTSQYARFWKSTPRISWNALGDSNEAHIQFHLQRGEIAIQATSDGKPIDCRVDTGSAASSWTGTLPVSMSHAGLPGPASVPSLGMTTMRPTKLMVVKDLKLGQLELRDIPGVAYGSGKEGILSAAVLYLGSSAFAQTILTIDYRKQELIAQPPGARIAIAPPIGLAKKHPRWNQWIPVTWDTVKPYITGCPMIAGSISGHPAHLLIDTGNTAFPLAITNPRLCAALRRANHGAMRPSAYPGFEQTLPINWTMASVKYRTPAVLMPYFGPRKSDATVGEQVLGNYRITIDYPRSKILFQWDPMQQRSISASGKPAN